MINLQILFSDVKQFMCSEVNRLFLLIILVNIILFSCVHYEIVSLKNSMLDETLKLDKRIVAVNKKVDFRYFNLSTSLEDIHNVKIDTLNGEIKKKY